MTIKDEQSAKFPIEKYGLGTDPKGVKKTLEYYNAKWTPKGWEAPDDLYLNCLRLKKLPKISKVGTSFSCAGNLLESLEGCPDEVPGAFWCHSNLLTSLEGGPSIVGNSPLVNMPKVYNCSLNFLASLKGSPTISLGTFFCNNNLLTSLKEGPEIVAGGFKCERNRLETLKGGPLIVYHTFYCTNNSLKNLDGQPCATCIKSDFGFQKYPNGTPFSAFIIDQEGKERCAPDIIAEFIASYKAPILEPGKPKEEPHALDVNWDSLNNTKSRGFPIGQKAQEVQKKLKRVKGKPQKITSTCCTKNDILGQERAMYSFLDQSSYTIKVTFDFDMSHSERMDAHTNLLQNGADSKAYQTYLDTADKKYPIKIKCLKRR